MTWAASGIEATAVAPHVIAAVTAAAATTQPQSTRKRFTVSSVSRGRGVDRTAGGDAGRRSLAVTLEAGDEAVGATAGDAVVLAAACVDDVGAGFAHDA